jgi:hypothetical protein
VVLEMWVCLHSSPRVNVAQQEILQKYTTPIQLLMKCISFAPPCSMCLAAVLLSTSHSQSHIWRDTIVETPSLVTQWDDHHAPIWRCKNYQSIRSH